MKQIPYFVFFNFSIRNRIWIGSMHRVKIPAGVTPSKSVELHPQPIWSTIFKWRIDYFFAWMQIYGCLVLSPQGTWSHKHFVMWITFLIWVVLCLTQDCKCLQDQALKSHLSCTLHRLIHLCTMGEKLSLLSGWWHNEPNSIPPFNSLSRCRFPGMILFHLFLKIH